MRLRPTFVEAFSAVVEAFQPNSLASHPAAEFGSVALILARQCVQ
jgi:hypothetical protein